MCEVNNGMHTASGGCSSAINEKEDILTKRIQRDLQGAPRNEKCMVQSHVYSMLPFVQVRGEDVGICFHLHIEPLVYRG